MAVFCRYPGVKMHANTWRVCRLMQSTSFWGKAAFFFFWFIAIPERKKRKKRDSSFLLINSDDFSKMKHPREWKWNVQMMKQWQWRRWVKWRGRWQKQKKCGKLCWRPFQAVQDTMALLTHDFAVNGVISRAPQDGPECSTRVFTLFSMAPCSSTASTSLPF